MKIKCIKGFRDKTTAKKLENQTRIHVGDILECDDELAKERIAKGLCVEVIDPAEDEAPKGEDEKSAEDEAPKGKKKNK